MNNVASWDTPTITKFASFKWDVAPWPAGPVARGTGSFGSGFGVTRDSKNVEEGWNYLREYLSKEGMETMWGTTGRGSPARNEAYPSWMNSPVAPENAEFFLEAMDTYAKTDRPYQTLAGGEILATLDRQTTLLRSGETTVEDAINAIMTEGTPVLEEAAKRLQGG
jgi:multiple sugar transport system substrate-binding protein